MRDYQTARDNRESFLRAVGATQEFLDRNHRVTAGLQVPHSLAGVWSILERLKLIVGPWRDLDPQSALPADVLQWVVDINRIKTDDDFREIEILDLLGVRSSKGGKQYPSQVFTGIFTSNPVWVSLWYQHPHESSDPESVRRAEAFIRLQATFVAAFSRITLSGRRPSAPNRPYEASILIFNLHGGAWPEQLDAYASCKAEPKALHRFFKEAHANGHRDLRQGFGALADLVNEGFELGQRSVFIKRNPTGRRRKRVRPGLEEKGNEVTYSWLFPSEPGAEGSDHPPTLIEVVGPGLLLEKDLIEHGLDPLEFSSGNLIWVPADDILDGHLADASPEEMPTIAPLGALYGAARARQRNEVMRAQLFTTRLGRTRPVSLARVFNVLESLLGRQLAQGSPDSSLTETLRFLAVMVVTGAEPESVVKLICYESPKKLPKDWRLAYSPKHRVWLHPYLPPDRQPLADRFNTARVENFPRVARSDIWCVGEKLGEPVRGRWFKREVSEYERIFTASVVPALRAEGLDEFCKFDAFRNIAYSWFLGREEGDQLRVAVVFDRDAATCETQHSYTAIDRAALDKYYAEGMEKLWQETFAVRTSDETQSRGSIFNRGGRATIPKGLCGDDLVPRMESLAALIEEMKNLIVGKAFPRESIQYHNLITAYLGLGLAVTAGFRDIRTPIPNLRLIDWLTGFLSLQEKDRKDGAHARLAWIAARLREQIARYLRHLGGLSARMPSNRNTHLYVKATKHRDKSQFNSGGYVLSLLDTLFFLEPGKDGDKAVEFTGTVFMRKLDEILPDHWPVKNAGRHFLRTYLVAAGCPAVAINTLLGHGHVGELPWGDDSALDPCRFRVIISPYIEQILDEIGFELLEFE